MLKEQYELPVTGHAEVIVKGTPATCTEAGKTDGTKCCVCGTIIRQQTEIAPTHNVKKWKVTKKATVLKAGQKTGKCSVCKKTIKQTIAKLPETIKVRKTVTIKVKKSTTIKVTYGKGDSVKSWKSSNKKIVTVTKKGKITGKKRGKAVLTVKLKSGKSAKVAVTVK